LSEDKKLLDPYPSAKYLPCYLNYNFVKATKIRVGYADDYKPKTIKETGRRLIATTQINQKRLGESEFALDICRVNYPLFHLIKIIYVFSGSA
jgi:hypothetical protein